MVLEFYNLREQPFGVTPDPKYLYLSPTHREALASLEYGISSSRGFLGLVAPPGMGKTTILFHLLQRLNQTARTVFIFQTHVTPRDFLRNLLSDMGLSDIEKDPVTLQAELNKLLLEEAKAGRRVVVVVDEAQNLEDPVLEHLRMLSNFETTSEKLIQIVLAGQTQLADKLASPALVQLRQRISIMGRLAPLDREQTERYINHRLEIAGYDRQLPLFSPPALRLIADASGGIPRNINNLCFNALALGCANRQQMIPTETIREVCQDLDLGAVRRLAPRDLAVNIRPKGSQGGLAKDIASVKKILFNWWLRLGPAAMILAIAVAGFALIGRNKATLPAENSPAPSVALVDASQATATTQTDTETRQNPPNPSPEVSNSAGPGAPSTSDIQTSGGSPLPESQTAFRTVRVTQDQTLSIIAMQELGEYSPKNLRAIQVLNPWLSDPDHIRAGQIIRIPEINLNREPTAGNAKPSPEEEKP